MTAWQGSLDTVVTKMSADGASLILLDLRLGAAARRGPRDRQSTALAPLT
jgi:hypothetical protein